MKRILILAALVIFQTSTFVWAAPKIEIVLTAEIDQKEVVDGKEVIQRIPANEVEPGQIIYYSLTYRNNGDANATEVKLNDPIPKETMYIRGSAFGEGATITFSADNGRSYALESQVTITVKNADGSTTEMPAKPDQFTHIRWTLDSVPAGFGGIVGFEAMVR